MPKKIRPWFCCALFCYAHIISSMQVCVIHWLIFLMVIFATTSVRYVIMMDTWVMATRTKIPQSTYGLVKNCSNSIASCTKPSIFYGCTIAEQWVWWSISNNRANIGTKTTLNIYCLSVLTAPGYMSVVYQSTVHFKNQWCWIMMAYIWQLYLDSFWFAL